MRIYAVLLFLPACQIHAERPQEKGQRPELYIPPDAPTPDASLLPSDADDEHLLVSGSWPSGTEETRGEPHYVYQYHRLTHCHLEENIADWWLNISSYDNMGRGARLAVHGQGFALTGRYEQNGKDDGVDVLGFLSIQNGHDELSMSSSPAILAARRVELDALGKRLSGAFYIADLRASGRDGAANGTFIGSFDCARRN